MPSAEAKETLRSRVRAARRQGPPADPIALARQSAEFLATLAGPRRVTCYASYGTEPSTGPLIAQLLAGGYDVLLPRVRGADLEWVLAGGPTTVSPMGIDEPLGDAVPLLPLRALLVPALAVSLDGARLGKGGGYYDRVLGSLGATPRAPVVALLRDDDILPRATVPCDRHDERVDVIITPTQVVHCTIH